MLTCFFYITDIFIFALKLTNKICMRRIGCKAMLLLGSIMVLGGTAQAQYLRSSYFMEGTSARLQLNPGL